MFNLSVLRLLRVFRALNVISWRHIRYGYHETKEAKEGM